MKLLVYSDIHLEFHDFLPSRELVEQADVVVLAGDIHPGTKGLYWAHKVFMNKPVVYVAGNHEFYFGEWEATIDSMRHAAEQLNIHFLENDHVVVDGVRFLGCTLWTDYKLYGVKDQELLMGFAQRIMEDFNLIGLRGDSSGLTPEHCVERHLQSREWLRRQLHRPHLEPTVVVTHHSPHGNSVVPMMISRPTYAPAYASRLGNDLLVRADLWVHGHIHVANDYHVWNGEMSTRIVSNPRGYVSRRRLGRKVEIPSFRDGLLVEVPSLDRTESRMELLSAD